MGSYGRQIDNEGAKVMKKCIVIPDSFKGTLSAFEICEIEKKAIQALMPGCEVAAVPVADGGEGTVDCFLYALQDCRKVVVDTTGPYGEPQKAYYARLGDTAIIEMAMCAGLPQVEGRQNPAKTTTYGVGTVMKKAVEAGCKKLVVGLGGSCTTDCGAGMGAALGVKFRDEAGEAFVPTGETLGKVKTIDLSEARALLDGVEVTAMCDVENPMYGPKGAAHVFGPQKGADKKMVLQLDEQVRQMADTIRSQLGMDLAGVPGSGAAGAMGAGIMAFAGGKLQSGISTVLDLIGFEKMLEGTDMVFTGEGRIDSQSLDGKVISGIAQRAKKQDVPVVCVVGSVGDGIEGAYDMGVTAIFSINQKAEAFETARHKSAQNLKATMENILRLVNACR